MKKYEFTGEVKQWLGRTLHQIRAVISFGVIEAGDIGGWIEHVAASSGALMRSLRKSSRRTVTMLTPKPTLQQSSWRRSVLI